jgi:predicted nucleotidyltransferase
MHFPTLVAQSELPTDVVEIVDQLLARKAATRELGTGALPNPIGRLIDAEFSNARELLAKRAAAPRGVRGRRDQFLLTSLGPLIVRMERSEIRERGSRITQALHAG